MTRIFGFTLLRNGVKYDYSFRESFSSLANIVEKIYLAIDPGEDSSLEEVLKIPKIHIVPSTWDMQLKKGLVLSVETNKALQALRADHGDEDAAWAIYLQADEVLHEEDYEILKNDIERAEEEGCDAISFRYLHFWKTHHHIAISKKWYPHEIRAIKLKSDIESWGDAQGFKNYQKVFYTEAKIFHYGHVREETSYDEKMRAMGSFYHDKKNLEERLKKGLKEAKKNKCALFFGTHPLVMKERILQMKDIWELGEVSSVAIVGNPQKYKPKLLSEINAQNIFWYKSVAEIPKEQRKKIVVTEPGALDYLLGRAKSPRKMKSKFAKEWSDDFKLIIYLSSQGVGLCRTKQK